MKIVMRAALIFLIAGSLVSLALAQLEGDPDSSRFKAVMAMQEMIESEGDEPLRFFRDEMIAPVIIDTYLEGDLIKMLRVVRENFRVSTFEGALPKGPYTVIMTFTPADPGDPSRLTFEIEAESPHRFVYIDY